MALADHGAEASEHGLLAAHLSECPDCRGRLAEMRQMDAILRGPGWDVLEAAHPSAESLAVFASARTTPYPDEASARPPRSGAEGTTLPAEEVRRIERHLSACTPCSREVDLLSEAAALRPVETQAGETAIPAAIREEIAKLKSESSRTHPLHPTPHPLRSLLTTLFEWLNPFRHPAVWAAATGVILIAVLVTRPAPRATVVRALPLVIEDRTLAAAHGGRSSLAAELAEQLEKTYPNILARLPELSPPEGRAVEFLPVGVPAGKRLQPSPPPLHGEGGPGIPSPERGPARQSAGGEGQGEEVPSGGRPSLQPKVIVLDNGLCSITVRLAPSPQRGPARQSAGGEGKGEDLMRSSDGISCAEIPVRLEKGLRRVLAGLDGPSTSQ